ncbi:MAG: nucleotidyl transferase AbiEii/AbiGii toxin family protein [Propionibacteriaceae bacterium]|nr:nucleotidyl transferase AbiEii/AbiGii toxin family protein [Micropruina sp.]HBY24649.1 hypothetical protein [Propionibacteriaceae bacterium]
MRAGEMLDVLGAVALGQWGLVTTAQAAKEGVIPRDLSRAVDRGLLRRVRHGVYAMHGGAAGDEIEDIRAEWLAFDPTRQAWQRRDDPVPIVVSDESAALVYGIGDLPPGGVHLTAERRLRHAPKTPVIAHRRRLHEREITWVDGLPVTSVRRTLEDLAQRWEHAHVLAATRDAIAAGRMPAAEVSKSPILLAVMPELAPAPTHQSLKQRMKNVRPADPGAAFNEFFRMQFLGRLGQHPSWVLKGGSHLICRLRSPRATKDLDLFLDTPDDAAASAELLVVQMDGATVGRYTFTVRSTGTVTEGHLDIARVKVVALADGHLEVATFSVDVSGSVILNADPVREVIHTEASIPGYPNQFSFALYPIENQLADKLCAMYQDYGRGHSTRYHDLYDAALIVDQLEFNLPILKEALRVQYERRNMVIPRDLPEPGPGWADTYNRVVPRLAGTRPPFTTYAEAMGAVRARIAPMLAELADEQ